ncbi:ABC transporter substrate-binding protein [Falsiroseomonas sp.]|uniref:ABC transporter substrate-binding protein n=1 Tax=Falsiroseomonas sp. TaxID=2870721 RepID=UPI003561C1D9
MDRVRIAVAHRGAGLSPVFAAIEGGFFREQGLEPEMVPYHGHPRSLAALLAGEVDFTNSVGGELILANLRHGGDAVVVASAISRSAQQVSARPGITSLERLRGARWGVTARGDADECAIVMAFERWGWDPGRDAEIVVVGADGPRLDLLLDERRVDAAIMHAPEPFQAAKRGWTLVEDLARLDVAVQNSCAATTRRMLEARPELVRRYVGAFCAGVHRFRTDPGFGIGVLRKYCGETDRQVLSDTWVLFARLMGGMMFPSLEGMRTAADLLRRVGAAPRLVRPEEVVAMEPLAALERERFFDRIMGVRSEA